MVKIVEADEDNVQVEQPQSQSQTQAQPHAPHSPSDSSAPSSHHQPHNSHSPPAAALQPSSQPPDSPNSFSSIFSEHTFHGFSPLHETPPSLSPSPPISTLPPLPAQPPDHAQMPAFVPVVENRLIRDQPEVITKSEPEAETGFAGEGGGDGGGTRHRRARPQVRVLRRARREKIVKRAALGLRVCEFVVCLVSFSVMAADKKRGWALDSFDRYTEFRYSMSVNVIGFAYSGLQGLDLVHQLTAGKNLSRGQLRYYFDFAIDQILAYLLLSAASSAFTRVDDWISNWGQDKFPAMASASVGVSFLAFAAFALSSLISGYILCTHRFT